MKWTGPHSNELENVGACLFAEQRQTIPVSVGLKRHFILHMESQKNEENSKRPELEALQKLELSNQRSIPLNLQHSKLSNSLNFGRNLLLIKRYLCKK